MYKISEIISLPVITLYESEFQGTAYNIIFDCKTQKCKFLSIINDEDELEKAKKKIGRGYTVQRYKGLGEMNADQLCDTTMDPKYRSLVKVNITDAALAEKRVSVLMGDAVEPRKNWINENVVFTLEDSYQI